MATEEWVFQNKIDKGFYPDLVRATNPRCSLDEAYVVNSKLRAVEFHAGFVVQGEWQMLQRVGVPGAYYVIEPGAQPSSGAQPKVLVTVNFKVPACAPPGGCRCETCKQLNPDAAPNRPGGAYLCYNCRA